jgi:cysteine desulfuration protein SufE
MTIDEIRDNFALLDDWDDRYRYVIELGRMLEPMSEVEHSAQNKVQGCAILLTFYSGHTPQQILATDAIALFDEFGFREHLTPQRSNGLRSMVERIRSDARQALAAAS